MKDVEDPKTPLATAKTTWGRMKRRGTPLRWSNPHDCATLVVMWELTHLSQKRFLAALGIPPSCSSTFSRLTRGRTPSDRPWPDLVSATINQRYEHDNLFTRALVVVSKKPIMKPKTTSK